MSVLTRSIFSKLNESADVKKPYGETPEEGKKETTKVKKGVKVPKGRINNKFKSEKLKNENKEAADAYANDTDKVMDNIDDKTHSDKGEAAKTTGKKSDKVIKYPFGNKPEASDSKLIKEGAECEECDKPIKEEYDNNTWMKYQHMIEGTLESAKEDMDEDAFQDFCEGVINLVQNYIGELDQLECAHIEESNKPEREEK